MVRRCSEAAKNHRDVTVVCDPKDYPRVLDGLEDMNNLTGLRAELARKVFARTAAYDSAISDYLNKQADTEPDLGEISGFPSEMKLQEPKAMTCVMEKIHTNKPRFMEISSITSSNCKARN